MSDVPAILVGAVIGAVGALGGGILTEEWHERHGERAALRLVHQELTDNAFRLETHATIADGITASNHSVEAATRLLPLSKAAWEQNRASIARSRKRKRVWAPIVAAYVSGEAADFYGALYLSRPSADSIKNWKQKCQDATRTINVAISAIARELAERDIGE